VIVAAYNLTEEAALMIHGGGHTMLSRKDIRPKQNQILLNAGFLPVSVDYRLCPEVNIIEGPMRDVCDALGWVRTTLPNLPLKRRDIRIDGEKVVVVGWSTGGTLAMSLGWTAAAAGIKPPEAIAAFYCPTDYEDPFWTQPNLPRGSEEAADSLEYNVWDGVFDKPITSYNPKTTLRAVGGWMAPSDPRSQIVLHMNWKGQALPVLYHGLNPKLRSDSNPKLPDLTSEQIQSFSPLAQIRGRKYKSPTFIVHGTQDDLIPWEQAQRTYKGLVQSGVEAELRIIDGGVHLFDIYPKYEENAEAAQAVKDVYRFLQAHV
jgi:acetyl esterase/lipase